MICISQINILPKEVYGLIAAGEVVERPMSVVKEMIENSIDAGAKHITVEIKNGGSTYIRITDDGCGIASDDVRKVFVPHATSKISSGEDLDSIGTLGFRGEAMASIAAVAKVEMLTKTADEETGSRYEIAGGEEISFSEAGCPQGTTVVVREIFYNVPARMKFLKKDVTEGNSVQGIVDRMAISHPEISFRFIRDGKQIVITSGNADLRSAVYSVFGQEFADTLVDVDYSFEGMSVRGLTGRPHQSRKSRAMQFFFINGRLVKSAAALAALEQAYKNSIMTGRFPACILNIELDPKLVDVNVHPAKIEVRFANEKPVFNLIYYGVKTAIEKNDSVKEGNFGSRSTENTFTTPVTHTAKVDFFRKKESAQQMKFSSPPRTESNRLSSPQTRYEIKPNENSRAAVKAYNDALEMTEKFAEKADFHDEKGKGAPAVVEEKDAVPEFIVVGEAFNTYIIVQIENDLYYIDKHAAHERINFEKLREQTQISSQLLLAPQAVRLSPEEHAVIMENLPLLEKCGFSAEDFGNTSVIVREAPSMLDGADIADLIVEIAQKLLQHKTDIEPDKMDWIFHSTACRSAVKGGNYTSARERELFVERLLSMRDIRYCPHGRPVMIKISRYELEKQFGRIQ